MKRAAARVALTRLFLPSAKATISYAVLMVRRMANG